MNATLSNPAHRQRARSVAALGLLLAVCGPAAATVARHLSLEEQLRHSDTVVLATVIAVEAEVEAGIPYVDATLEIAEVLAGDAPPNPVRVRRRGGGFLDGRPQPVIAGDAILPLGERVVVFLRSGPTGFEPYTATALAQSTWQVAGEEQGDGDVRLRRDLRGLSLVVPGERPGTLRSRPAAVEITTLGALEREIAAARRRIEAERGVER